MRALHDLVLSAKVRYIGASAMWTYQFASMQFVAESNGWTKFVSMQNLWNLCYREEEREMVKYCKETGVGIIPYSPMHGGKLARPLGYESVRASAPHAMNPALTEADEEIVKRVEKVAKERGKSMSQVALNWLIGKGAVPIVGFNSVDRVEDAYGLRGMTLTDEEVEYLEEPYVPKNVTSHR